MKWRLELGYDKTLLCQYARGAHPHLLSRLIATNQEHCSGYGLDSFSDQARQTIRKACGTEKAEVHCSSEARKQMPVSLTRFSPPMKA